MKSHITRRFRTLPVGHKAVWIELPIAKVWCQECLVTRQVAVSFAKPKKHSTTAFARLVVELSGFMTPTDVSCFLGISGDTARDILKEHLGQKYGQSTSGFDARIEAAFTNSPLLSPDRPLEMRTLMSNENSEPSLKRGCLVLVLTVEGSALVPYLIVHLRLG